MTSALLPIGGTFSGCIGCMLFVESLAKLEPGCMNLMTFSTFLFVSLEGLVFVSKFLTVKNKIPIRAYIQVIVIFFAVNVINNQALNFHIPVPLHIIFRSGSLMASLILGKLILRRTYSLRKYISILVITIGIIIVTLATSNIEKKSSEDFYSEGHHFELALGLLMLVVALLASAYLGICQERLYISYGKHFREAMFYVHALALPGFALFGMDIFKYARVFSESAPYQLWKFDTGVPRLWVFLFGACVLQPFLFQYLLLCVNFYQPRWVCIRFVYSLTSQVSSLTVTLVVTLRKFFSLVISVFFFNNIFTEVHWLGTVLVFGGTLAFADIWPRSKTVEIQ